jgi:ERCC4-related helicase
MRRPQFQRCIHLKGVLLEKREQFGEDLHVIVFVQQRVTAHIVQHFIETDEELRAFCRPAVTYSRQSRATPSLNMSPSAQRANLAAFAWGERNVLVATSVAEEGMDVAAANCVIRFDAIQVCGLPVYVLVAFIDYG